MTYKEAKKAIEAIIFCAENMTIECDGFNDCRKNCKGYVTYEEERESYSVAIEALEKQIPKKPQQTYENGYHHAFCPKCKNGLGLLRTYKNGRNFCPYCGQAIDWSEVEK